MERLKVAWFPFCLIFTLGTPWAGSKVSPVPFKPDEVMVYEVKWKAPLFFMPAVHAGFTTLRVLPPANYEGKPALHFTATAKSDGFFPRLGGIDIDDSFDSIVSADDFCSLKIVKIQKEGGRKRDIVLTFDSERKNTHVLEKDIATMPPRVTRDETLPLPACTVDVLSVFYAARRFNLEMGKSFNMMLSDNGTTRPITITVEKREQVDTGEGKVPAVKLRTGSAMGLFSRGGTFSIWYSDDELRVPVRFEAKVNFGKVYGWLQSYQGAGNLRIKN
ncbi:MAG TPA: DUF3108 domain-containing protein [Acidobacteriota bacterium]|jgi:hypothetical protein|nr:DUF3108 domain-containing protein [Acidobacteriota bacterium]